MVTARKIIQVSVIAVALVVVMFFTAVVTMRLITWGKSVDVPNVAGMELSDGINALNQAGLEIKVDRKEFHQSVPAGSIIIQNPQPGASVKRGRNISVVVSLGSQEITVPYLAGEVFRRAQILLIQAGLTLGDVARAPSGAPRDSVIAQDPPARTVLQKGEKVDLMVSDGPAITRFITPDLTGLSLIEAEEVTRPLALRLNPGGGGEVVVSQDPKPGFPIRAGATLNVMLGQRRAAGLL